MSELPEFLLARIAEDEADAQEHGEYDYYDGGWDDYHVARVLAECDAKRRIVKAWGHVLDATDTDPFTRQVHETAGHVFRCLALPYGSHKDYRQEWKL